MRKSRKPGFYAVARERAPGIYSTWDEYQAQTLALLPISTGSSPLSNRRDSTSPRTVLRHPCLLHHRAPQSQLLLAPQVLASPALRSAVAKIAPSHTRVSGSCDSQPFYQLYKHIECRARGICVMSS
ncbi:hypothetical protein FKP32DRAFT_1136360 [Trametes sanguinea]|nr:hypothetical protein FKP32DRAFT_1136360 [Trametes sanguinea]